MGKCVLHAVWIFRVNPSGIRFLNAPPDCAWVINCTDNCMLHAIWASRLMQVALKSYLLIVHEWWTAWTTACCMPFWVSRVKASCTVILLPDCASVMNCMDQCNEFVILHSDIWTTRVKLGSGIEKRASYRWLPWVTESLVYGKLPSITSPGCSHEQPLSAYLPDRGIVSVKFLSHNGRALFRLKLAMPGSSSMLGSKQSNHGASD